MGDREEAGGIGDFGDFGDFGDLGDFGDFCGLGARGGGHGGSFTARVSPARPRRREPYAGGSCGRWTFTVAKALASAYQLRLANDLVNDVCDRCGGVDRDPVLRDVFFRLMQSRNEFPFLWLSAAPLRVGSLVKPSLQCVDVDFKDEDAVEQIDELREIP
jgi:hypothetical protein